MGMAGKVAYTVNDKTKAVDRWNWVAEFNGVYHNRNERLCVLRDDKGRMLILPRRCIFETEEAAREVLK